MEILSPSSELGKRSVPILSESQVNFTEEIIGAETGNYKRLMCLDVHSHQNALARRCTGVLGQDSYNIQIPVVLKP
jgi:hypothetical protein